ncbi:hypothetical protein Tco_0976809 [Tanacetum coccineum]|uniref:Monodehydroascorbate reductase n=1 Tax=Tanacetum coccineum TaxID=301880 RepID=A0ABQ5EJF9_9ASTR
MALTTYVDADHADTMADVNVNAPAEQAPAMAPPTRTDEQILPRSRWVPVGKSNCYLDVERSQSNPIYKISVDILKHTNFFRAFIASSTIPSIYIQQFWDTVRYDKTTGSYSCQLDEQWFDLTKDTLRDALQITPVDNNNAFSSPPTPDVLIKFVNNLGYPKVVRTLSDVVTNDMFQPWRALTTIINLCLTGKTSGFERPRAPVLQILWGVVKRAHIDYAERMWEEFTQSIHTFIEDKKNLAQHTQGKKKATLIVIPSVRFTKLIIHHLQSKHKFHPRPGSPLHLPNEEPVLGYLKFSAKGTKREVFGMPIPNNLITADIQGEQYYNAYLEKVAKHQRYLAGEEVSDPDSPAPKPAKATKPKATKQSKPLAPKAAPVTKPAAAKAPKTTASRPPKPTPATTKPSKKTKKRTQKSYLQLVDKFVDEGVPVNDPKFGDEKADLQKAVEERKSQGLRLEITTRPELTKTLCIQDEGQSGSNLGKLLSLTSNQVMFSCWTKPEYMDVEENLKLPTKDQVRLEEPARFAGTLSSLQNLDKEFSFTNQFLEEKSPEDEPEKTNTESEVQSMVTVPIHQDTSSVPLMTTPVIDLTVSQPVSTTVQAPLPTSIATAIQALLKDRFRDLPEADMKEILHHRISSLIWLKQEERRKGDMTSGASGLSQLPPPPPPPSTNQSDQSKSTAAPSSSKTATSAEYTAWTTTNTRLKPSVSLIPEDLHMDADSAPDEQVHSSNDEDIRNAHIPKVNLKQDWWKPLSEEDRLATPEPAWSIPSSDLPVPMNNWAAALASTYAPPPENSLLAQTGDMAIFMDWFCKKQGIMELTQKDLEGPAFEIVKVFHPNVIKSPYQMEECHKLLTRQVTCNHQA